MAHELCKFVKYDMEGNEIDTVAFFTSRCVITLPQEDEETLNLSINQACYKMFVDYQEFQREGSGWAIDEVLYLKLMMAKHVPPERITIHRITTEDL